MVQNQWETLQENCQPNWDIPNLPKKNKLENCIGRMKKTIILLPEKLKVGQNTRALGGWGSYIEDLKK